MLKKYTLGALAALGLTLAACAPPTPTPSPAPTVPANARTPNPTRATGASEFASKTVEGGAVTVEVTPIALKPGAPFEFKIAMDTHSVDLVDDMLKAVVLRDDSGKEYAPLEWNGAGPGGHHRSGTVKFASPAGNPRALTLIVQGVGKVAERVYRWEMP